MAAAGKICPANAEVEEGVTAEYYSVSKEADAARTMSRCVKNGEMQIIDLYGIAVPQQPFRLG